MNDEPKKEAAHGTSTDQIRAEIDKVMPGHPNGEAAEKVVFDKRALGEKTEPSL
jgi:hypothetical protein